jgi:hypothetical protein
MLVAVVVEAQTLAVLQVVQMVLEALVRAALVVEQITVEQPQEAEPLVQLLLPTLLPLRTLLGVLFQPFLDQGG